MMELMHMQKPPHVDADRTPSVHTHVRLDNRATAVLMVGTRQRQAAMWMFSNKASHE